MENEIRCECGKVFSTKRSLYTHQSQSCPRTAKARGEFVCPECSAKYKHLYTLKRHLKICSPASNQSTEPEQEISTSFGSSSTVTNSPITSLINSDHNNITINYYANLDVERITKLFAEKFGPEYIKQGENGLYEFIYCEILTDPLDSKNTAIICVNQRDQVFHYGVFDPYGKPVIREDVSLTKFNTYLQSFNGLIRTLVSRASPYYIGCVGVNNEETKKNVDTLINSMIERKKMPLYLIDKVGPPPVKQELVDPLSVVLSEEEQQLMIKKLEDEGLMPYMNYVPTEEEKKAMEELAIRDRLLTPERIKQRNTKLKTDKKKLMSRVQKKMSIKPSKTLAVDETIQELSE